MHMTSHAQRLTIYIDEPDKWQGKLLYMALLEKLRKAGLAGATVTRGIAGFGAHAHIHTATLVDVTAELPIIIQVIDTPARIAGVLDTVSQMVGEGLITLEDITVIKYSHRYMPPLPQHQHVRDVMSTDVASVQPDTPLHDVVQLLLQRSIKAVPVVTADRKVVGIITGGDLLTRGGLPVRLSLHDGLPNELADHHLHALEESGKVARDVMTPQSLTIRADATLGQAAQEMALRQLKRLPVTDGNGHLVGIISRIDILRAITTAAKEGPAVPPPPAGIGLQVQDVMVTDVPTAQPGTPIDEVLNLLVASPLRRVVVVDETGHVVGLVTDGMLLSETVREKQPGLWERVRRGLHLGEPSETRPVQPPPATCADDVMTREVYTVRTTDSILTAIEQMVEHRVKRLVVVDDQGRLKGMIGRQRVLQAVASEPGSAA